MHSQNPFVNFDHTLKGLNVRFFNFFKIKKPNFSNSFNNHN